MNTCPNLQSLSNLYLAERLGLSAAHRADVLSVARRCGAAIDPASGLPLQQAISAWLQAALDAGRSPACVARYRRVLLAVLRWAAEQGLTPPVRLPAVRVPQAVPEAWTVEQVAAIVRAALAWPGSVGDWPASLWWPAVILSTYWTGARIGSLMAASPNDWEPEAACLLLKHTKNGNPALYKLHEQAASFINRVWDRRAEKLFVWPGGRWVFFRAFRRIVEAAGVPCPRSKGFGLFHRLRKTTLSYCWAVDPALAQRQADHSSQAVTRRHYVDPRLVIDIARSAADVLPVPKI